MPRRIRRVVAIAALGVLVPLGASRGQTPATAASPTDSLAVLRVARQEQARFEMVRRQNLPVAPSNGSVRCDERIGRFCISHEDDGDPWVPPPERPATRQARDRLIARLTEAARRIPGDWWVTGQRVRYLIEARRFTEAYDAAQECRAGRWWCAGLAGVAKHMAGEPGPADSAFSEMLASMPSTLRDQWLDPSLLLDQDLLRYFRRLPSAEHAPFVERFWKLADPFFSRPGNEIRSEHLARQMTDDLQDRAESPEDLAWGSDMREILIRYGWPVGWEQSWDRDLGDPGTTVVAHYAGTGSGIGSSGPELLPPAAVFIDTAGIAAGVWDVEDTAARADYALPIGDSIARWLKPLDRQIAVFQRGDSDVVVAAYDLPPDSLPRGTVLDAALAVVTGTAEVLAIARTPDAGPHGALRVTVAAQPVLASLELVAERARRVTRAREGLSLPPIERGRLAVSDLLLLRDETPLPSTLDEAMRQARGSIRARAGENVGVYWEVYGITGAPDLNMSVGIVSQSGGWLRRAARRLGVVRESEPVRLRWQEAAPPGGTLGRALLLQVPRELRPGSYGIELTVETPGAPALISIQEIEVVR